VASVRTNTLARYSQAKRLRKNSLAGPLGPEVEVREATASAVEQIKVANVILPPPIHALPRPYLQQPAASACVSLPRDRRNSASLSGRKRPLASTIPLPCVHTGVSSLTTKGGFRHANCTRVRPCQHR
jgi:hypothetical protein